MPRAAMLMVAVLVWGELAIAHARPVPVGRYVEIPYGISARHPWRTGQGDPQRTARSRVPIPQGRPTKRWETSVGAGRVFTPAIAADGTLYVGSRRGLTALGADGSVRWSAQLGFVSGTPSLTPDGSLAVGVQSDTLLVVDGRGVQAHARLGGRVLGSPLVLDDGSIVVAAYDHAVHRVGPEGRHVFRTSVRTRVRGSVAQVGDLLVVPAAQELLWLTLGGAPVRATSLGAEVVLGPAVADDGVVWVVTDDGVLSAVASNGRMWVRAELGGPPSSSSNLAIAGDGSLRMGTVEAGLVCVEPSGTVRWRLQAHGAMGNGLTVDAEGAVLTVAGDGTMLAVDDAGAVLWEVGVGARTDAAPVLGADGTIYVTTFSGTLQAWR